MNIKKVLVCLALLATCISIAARVQNLTNRPITPETHIFLVDLDDTIVKKSPYGRLVWNNKGVIASALQKHPKLAWSLWRSGASAGEWQAAFKALGNNEKQFAEIIQQISREKTIIEGMDAVIETLHKQGFTIQPLTNMAEHDYRYLESQYPTLFAAFTNPQYVRYDADKKKIKKPMPEYYQHFAHVQRDNNLNPANKQYIFLDDKRKNCAVAHEILGLEYIVVPGNTQNADFVKSELGKRGLVL